MREQNHDRSERPALQGAPAGGCGGRAALRDEEREILALAAAGREDDAARLLLTRYHTDVYRYCRERLRESWLAEDVQQRVFIEACRDLQRFAGRSSLRTWLLRIARNRCLDAARSLRRQRSHIELAEPAECADPGADQLDKLAAAQLLGELSECLECVGPLAREPLLLHFEQGLSFEEMTHLCGAKADTLRARVARALRVLRACIEARAALNQRACLHGGCTGFRLVRPATGEGR
jgi:RNA polymerase sigma-70 factor (ECF subfamily)